MLTLLGVVCVLWLILFYYYNYRTLSVSEKSFETRKDLGSDAWDQDRWHYLHSEKRHTAALNDSLSLVQKTYTINNHDKENSHSDDAQNNSSLHIVSSSVPQTVRSQSRTPAREVDKDTRQRQYSVSHDSNAAINLIPEWLRWDPLLQQMLRRNISRSAWKHQLLEETWTTTKLEQMPSKPVKEPLLASGHKPSGSFEFDVQHSADRYKRVVLSVVDSGYTDFAVNFQRLSIDAVGLQNFLFVCIDQQAVMTLRQHGIACAQFHQLTAVQVIEMSC